MSAALGVLPASVRWHTPGVAPIDRLLTELRDLPRPERLPVWTLWRFHELGDVSQPPTVESPEWLPRAIVDAVHGISQHWQPSPVFGTLRMLEQLGVVSVEHDDTYVLAMVSALGDRWDGRVRTDALRRDAELRELLWRVFEVEGGGEVSLANVDKFSQPDATWARTFRDLLEDGTLPRGRVLESCLLALGRDFSAYRAGWFSQLYRSLEPTAAERVAHQPLLLRLLRSSVAATVSFAVAQLAVIAKSGGLDDDGYVAECAAAMVAPARSTATGAVKLAAAVAARRPDLVPAVAQALGAGLAHSHRDVQSDALAVLRSLAAREIVEARLDELEPSVRRAAAQWLGLPGTLAENVDPAVAVDMTHPLVPAGDTTVAELGARLLAGHLGAVDVERFLAQLAVKDTAGLGALRKQAGKVMSDPRWERTLRRHIAALVIMAAGESERVVTGPRTFLGLRLGEVVEVLVGRRAPTPLLATPTEPPGWLDPRVFVDRLAASPEPPTFDVVAALLRLAPEGRAEALQSARTLPGESGAAARYALGGKPADVVTRPLWVAAARARAPLADDPHLLAARVDGAGQGRAATYCLHVRAREYRFEQRGRTRVAVAYHPSLRVAPEGARERADQPTVVGPWDGHARSSAWHRLDADWTPWHAYIWPHDAEPFFAVRVDEVLTASSAYPTVTYGTSAILDALLTHPGRLGPMTAATLAAGLSTSDVQHRVIAAEACARLVPAGRIAASELASAMANLAGHCTATRWAATLRDSARSGQAAAAAVVEVLDHLLPQLGSNHPGLGAILETRYEEAVRLGLRAVREPARAWLESLRGGSKAARTARLILAEATGGDDRR